MTHGQSARVSIAVDRDAVSLVRAGDTGGVHVSAGGHVELRGEACALLNSGLARHYWIELRDADRQVVLHPCE